MKQTKANTAPEGGRVQRAKNLHDKVFVETFVILQNFSLVQT